MFPHQMGPGTDLDQVIALVNDNFMNLALSISAVGFTEYGNVSADTSVVVAAGTRTYQTYEITSESVAYSAGVSGVTVRLGCYIDTDGNSAYRMGIGTSLSADQLKCWAQATVLPDPNAGSVATIVVMYRNDGSSSHTFYPTVEPSFYATPPTGQFR